MCEVDRPFWCWDHQPTSSHSAAAPGDEAGGPNDDERVEADIVSNVSLGLARIHF